MSARGHLTPVAFQGEPSANGEAAILRYWNGAARPVPTRSFPSLIDAVAEGGIEFGVVPVWNSIIGDVAEAREALENAGERVVQVGEVTVPVRHALLALPGASLHSVRVVGSHRAALAQCSRFFAANPRLTPVVAWDTAGAAAELAALARGDAPAVHDDRPLPWYARLADARPLELAVIASAAVAARHGLQVLAEDIQDEPRSETRFVVVRAREEGASRW